MVWGQQGLHLTSARHQHRRDSLRRPKPDLLDATSPVYGCRYSSRDTPRTADAEGDRHTSVALGTSMG